MTIGVVSGTVALVSGSVVPSVLVGSNVSSSGCVCGWTVADDFGVWCTYCRLMLCGGGSGTVTVTTSPGSGFPALTELCFSALTSPGASVAVRTSRCDDYGGALVRCCSLAYSGVVVSAAPVSVLESFGSEFDVVLR